MSRTSIRRKPATIAAGKPQGWKKAEWMYDALRADQMMPMLHGPLAPSELVERLQEIVAVCDRFYPAVLELGLRALRSGDPGEGERLVNEGFDRLLELAEAPHRTREIELVVSNLERVYRYDCLAQIAETMVRREPLNADWHDSLAHALARMGQLDAAAREAAEAVRLAPQSPFFRSNQGWILLMAGNLRQARIELDAAAELDVEHRVVQGNLEVLGYLEAHGGTYLDYLVRPLDLARIESLANEEDYEAVDNLCANYNDARQEAMVCAAMRGDELQRRKLPDLLATLTTFFQFVQSVREDAYQLDEDIEWLTDHFQPLMHKFIFKHGDADPQMIEEICDALLEFTNFLVARDLVKTSQGKAFRSKLQKLRPEMIRKTTRYGQVRHNHSLSEEEKEQIREELFEGDHFWPTL